MNYLLKFLFLIISVPSFAKSDFSNFSSVNLRLGHLYLESSFDLDKYAELELKIVAVVSTPNSGKYANMPVKHQFLIKTVDLGGFFEGRKTYQLNKTISLTMEEIKVAMKTKFEHPEAEMNMGLSFYLYEKDRGFADLVNSSAHQTSHPDLTLLEAHPDFSKQGQLVLTDVDRRDVLEVEFRFLSNENPINDRLALKR